MVVYKANQVIAWFMKYFSQTPLKMMVIMPNEGVSLDDYATDFTSLEYTTLLDSVDVTKTAKAKIPEFSVSGDKSAEDITQIVEKSLLFFSQALPCRRLTFSS